MQMKQRMCWWCQRGTNSPWKAHAWYSNNLHTKCNIQFQTFKSVTLSTTQRTFVFNNLGNKHNPYGRHGKPVTQST